MARPRVGGQPGGTLTVAAARHGLTGRFRRRGVESAALDARIIVAHALGLDHAALAAQGARALTSTEAASIDALACRRLAHEPVARIVGRKEFWSLCLSVDSETFVPRPDSETVVEAALEALAGVKQPSRTLRIADLGTGSGALLLAILSELAHFPIEVRHSPHSGADFATRPSPAAFGVGTDVSVAALACARGNAARLTQCAAFIACHYGSALEGPVDLIVSNPPYIPTAEIPALPPEVRMFDPRCALDGGQDGLDGYRAIAADARRLLAPEGLVVVELGFAQAGEVSSLFAQAGLAPSAMRHDVSGIPRALVARRVAG
jgi:release factor glutamine methyltransferase